MELWLSEAYTEQAAGEAWQAKASAEEWLTLQPADSQEKLLCAVAGPQELMRRAAG